MLVWVVKICSDPSCTSLGENKFQEVLEGGEEGAWLLSTQYLEIMIYIIVNFYILYLLK